MNQLEKLVNPHLIKMTPYSSARDEFKGKAEIYLDANESYENSFFDSNRYPDPEAVEVRKVLEKTLSLPFSKTALGNGSDELIDYLIRIFCAPNDAIAIVKPTYGAYKVFSSTNNIKCIEIPQNSDLTINKEEIFKVLENEKVKILFLCSPNNPTGKVIPFSLIKEISDKNKGITVVDEAYADFARSFRSAVELIDSNERVVVIRTLSKAWAIAGSRVGILVSSEYLQRLFLKIKAPYNVSLLNQRAALKALKEKDKVQKDIKDIISYRKDLEEFCKNLEYVKEIIPTETNFILIRVGDADSLYSYLLSKSIIVRNRTHELYLEGVLRITVGNKRENEKLKEALLGYKG